MTTPNTQPSAPAGRYLTFTLGEESYGFPVLKVREIIRLCPITPVPQDLRAKLQFATTNYGERACIIVVQATLPSGDTTLIGAIVDAVEEVVHLGPTDIEAAPDFGGAPDTQCMLGLATIQGGVKTLLNIEKIFLTDGSVPTTSQPKPEPTTKIE